MCPFERENDVLSRPLAWYIDGTFVPSTAYIVFVGCEEEGEFDVSRTAIRLHVRIVVERTIVERSCPWGMDTGVVALQSLGHRAG